MTTNHRLGGAQLAGILAVLGPGVGLLVGVLVDQLALGLVCGAAVGTVAGAVAALRRRPRPSGSAPEQ